MDNNQKVLAYGVGALVSFIVAAIAHYVIGTALIGWGVSVVVGICALVLLFCACAPQSVERRMPPNLRIFLFIIAGLACFAFSAMFMTWTWVVIYLACLLAGSVVAGLSAKR